MRREATLASWLRTRRAMRFSPQRLADHRQEQWQQLQPTLRSTPALAPHAGKPLQSLPVVDVQDIRRDYGRWNSLGLSDARVRRLADDAEAGTSDAGELSAGYSTGTSGRRGIFITSAAERADYIGQSLARLLPLAALFRRQRLALHLRANNTLYGDAASRRLAFAYLPLASSLEETLAELQAWGPTILIAPPHRLLALAAMRGALPGALRHLFYGSEPMSERDCAIVSGRFGIVPRAIYQATEGFLGASCRYGALHLNDHSLEIELEPVPGTRGFRPIITDLRRRSQPIVRVRGDDYLELVGHDCGCGFAGRIVAPPAGRVQDIWRYAGRAITPGQVVTNVEALEPGLDWSAVGSRSSVELRFDAPIDRAKAKRIATEVQLRLAIPVPVLPVTGRLPAHGPKRRKVEWCDD